MMMQGEIQAKVETRLRTMRVLWGFFLITAALFMLVTFVVGPQGERYETGNEATLFAVFLVMGLSLVAASFVVRGLMQKRAIAEGKAELVHTAMIVALALCEGAVLFGLVSYFVTGHRYSFVLFVVGALGELAHFPRREQLLAAMHKSREP